MIITKPELPAKAGYVEVIDLTGSHVYMPTQETIDKQAQQMQIEEQAELIKKQEEIINKLLGVTEEEEVAIDG